MHFIGVVFPDSLLRVLGREVLGRSVGIIGVRAFANFIIGFRSRG